MGSEEKGRKETGAERLLVQGMRLSKKSRVMLVANENRTGVAIRVAETALNLGIRNIMFVQILENQRPMKFVPNSMLGSLDQTDAVILFADRMTEEDYRFNRPLMETCQKNEVTFCYLYDPVPRYLDEGIAAHYRRVEKEAQVVAQMLRESGRVKVESDSGTNLEFQLYKTIIPRGPIYSDVTREPLQSPEGEVTSVPIESTFSGKLVANHTVTKVGIPPAPITWTFKSGQVVDVEGDARFLSTLLDTLRKSDSRIKSLRGMWIAEFSVGVNKWAILDGNISNCEKVAGCLHFGMGQTYGNIGKARGEKYHFDSMVTNATVTTMTKAHAEHIIEKGKLLV